MLINQVLQPFLRQASFQPRNVSQTFRAVRRWYRNQVSTKLLISVSLFLFLFDIRIVRIYNISIN